MADLADCVTVDRDLDRVVDVGSLVDRRAVVNSLGLLTQTVAIGDTE